MVNVGFLTLTAQKKKIGEARNRKLYLLIFKKISFFIIFSSQNKKKSVISYSCHTQKCASDSSHEYCAPTLQILGIKRILHRHGLQRADLHTIDIRHELHSKFLSRIHLLLLTPRKQLTRLMAKLMVSLYFLLSSPRIL